MKAQLICSGYTLIYRTEHHLEFDTDACSRSAMSQKRHPIWFPHCPTCTVTNSRGILCRPPRNSTRRGWTWTSMRSLHFKCRSFHKPAALLWTIPPLPFFSFSLPFSSHLLLLASMGTRARARCKSSQICIFVMICTQHLVLSDVGSRASSLCLVRLAPFFHGFVLFCRAHPCCQKHMVVTHLGSKHINQRRLTNRIL